MFLFLWRYRTRIYFVDAINHISIIVFVILFTKKKRIFTTEKRLGILLCNMTARYFNAQLHWNIFWRDIYLVTKHDFEFATNIRSF